MAKEKDKKAKKGKGKGAGPKPDWPEISVSAHPRAQRSIRTTKAWAGLLGFLVVAFFSYQAGVETFEAGLRALVAGIVFYVVTWAVSVALWQRIVVHEARTVAERRRDERLEAMKRLMNPEGSPDDDKEATA